MFPLLGLFGGTFDPIHNGHLSLANELIKKLALTEIQFIPSKKTHHRPAPITSLIHRIEMIKHAIVNQSQLVLNDIEIKREAISYSIDTLKLLRSLFPCHSLCFILSTDAFSEFNQWHQYLVILEYCHLIVINRPNYHLPQQQKWLDDLLSRHQTKNLEDLSQFLFGKIFFQFLSTLPISATEIRNLLAKGDYETVALFIPKRVLNYIEEHKLY